MIKEKSPIWTDVAIFKEAKKYERRTAFHKGSKSAYMAAWKKDILDEACAHMKTKPRKKKGHWNSFENLKQAVVECEKIEILRKHSAYPHILKHPRKNELLELAKYRKIHVTEEVFIKRKEEIERKFNLKCIDNVYSGVDKKYEFECMDCDYSWFAILDNVYSGKSNCPKCAGLAKRTIEEIHKKAHAKSGVCTDTVYTNIKDLYGFICAEGHTFPLTGEAVLTRDAWCPDCYESPLKGKFIKTIDDIKKIVEGKSGILKSQTYRGMDEKYKIICEKGHPFSALGSNLTNGKWCPKCAGRGRTILYCQNLANQKNGECLEPVFLGMDVKHQWRCGNNHEWPAKPSKISQGQWCPYCKNPNENFCRTVLEQMLEVELPKKRPKWLLEITGKRLELDGYSKNDKIAFEYNGVQHYNFSPSFHKSEKCLKSQQNRDLMKRKACKEYGVILISVPFFEEGFSIPERLKYLEKIVLNLNLDIKPEYYELKRKNKLKFISPEIEVLRKKIGSKGGILEDTVYIDSMHPITVSCSQGHRWQTKGEYINQGKWCKECHIDSIRKN